MASGGNLAGQIRKLNKQLEVLTAKSSKVKDKSAREEAAFHAALTGQKARSLGAALSSSSIISRLSTHTHTTKKSGKRK
jgi:hypothetical protein